MAAMRSINAAPCRAARAARPMLLLTVLCLLLPACTTTPPPSPPVEVNEPRIIPGVPFHAQEEFHCGPASLAALLNFLGDPVTPRKIANEIFRNDIRGTLTLDMGLYPRMRGFSSTFGSGTPKALVATIDSGTPAVVMVNQGLVAIRKLHYMVVTGYTPKAVIVNTEQQEGLRLPWDDFLPSWERAEYWMLTVTPGEKG